MFLYVQRAAECLDNIANMKDLHLIEQFMARGEKVNPDEEWGRYEKTKMDHHIEGIDHPHADNIRFPEDVSVSNHVVSNCIEGVVHSVDRD